MSSSTVYNNAVRGSCMFITICIWLWAFCCYLFGDSYLEESLSHMLLAALCLCVYSIGGLRGRLEKFSPIPRSASFTGDAVPWYRKLWSCVFVSWGAVTWWGLIVWGIFLLKLYISICLGRGCVELSYSEWLLSSCSRLNLWASKSCKVLSPVITCDLFTAVALCGGTKI